MNKENKPPSPIYDNVASAYLLGCVGQYVHTELGLAQIAEKSKGIIRMILVGKLDHYVIEGRFDV